MISERVDKNMTMRNKSQILCRLGKKEKFVYKNESSVGSFLLCLVEWSLVKKLNQEQLAAAFVASSDFNFFCFAILLKITLRPANGDFRLHLFLN